MGKPTLVYGFDPLCGWCYAFSGTMRTLREEFADKVDWEVACGGLVTGERVKPIGEMREYLIRGEQMLRERAGVTFGAAYRDGLLADGRWVGESEPACRAILIVQDLHGGAAAVDFGGELTVGLYRDGLPPDDPATLTGAAGKLGLDADALLERWRQGPGATADAMARAREEGVRMYPSLFLRQPGGLQPIYEGFASADDIRRLLQPLIG